MTATVAATERKLYKAYVTLLPCLTIIHSSPGGVKVSANTFAPLVRWYREIE